MVKLKGPTTSSERCKSDGKVSWSQFEGTKKSHDEIALQQNLKDIKTNDHIFYEPKTGKSGCAGGNRNKSK